MYLLILFAACTSLNVLWIYIYILYILFQPIHLVTFIELSQTPLINYHKSKSPHPIFIANSVHTSIQHIYIRHLFFNQGNDQCPANINRLSDTSNPEDRSSMYGTRFLFLRESWPHRWKSAYEIIYLLWKQWEWELLFVNILSFKHLLGFWLQYIFVFIGSDFAFVFSN